MEISKNIVPDKCFYRVSVKAIIRGPDHFSFLLVKEDGSDWILPGGGVDHGESMVLALQREMKEELGYSGRLACRFSHVYSHYAAWRGQWVMWIIFEVQLLELLMKEAVERSALETSFVPLSTLKSGAASSETVAHTLRAIEAASSADETMAA